MLPNFLVIGAPRSGTTFIDENLRRHPQVFMAKRKEVHFFDGHYDEGIDAYEKYFKGYGGQPAIGEATPDYLHGQWSKNDIPFLIHRHLPNIKLIASLRNPVDRAYSRFWNSKAKNPQSAALSFEEKLLERSQWIREGFYYEHLQRFLAYFPREKLLILLYDELQADPQSFMRRIYRFLEVDCEFQSRVEHAVINAAAGKRRMAHSRLLYGGTRILAKLGLHKASNHLRQLNSVPTPPMNAETRRRLVEIYHGENLKLQSLIEQDISHWNQ